MSIPLAYNVRSLLVRWRSTVPGLGGVALCVAVAVGLLSMESGFRLALRATGRSENALVLQQGSQVELNSWFSKAAGDVVALDPRVTLASPELVTIVALPRASDGALRNVTLRGVTPAAFRLHDDVTIVEGRPPRPGLFEIAAGARAQKRIRGLRVGSRLRVMRRDFDVVGVFAAGGNAFESELWSDFDAMASAFNRQGGENSLTVRLNDPATLAAFDRDLRANPQFQLEAKPERTYYEDQGGPLTTFLRALALFVAVVMGIGAAFGAMNTMYAMVASRTSEIGTLRALGFSRLSILLTFVVEGELLALCGGVAGCLLALVMNGVPASTPANMSEIAFAFRVTAADVAYGMAFPACMGIAGTLLPAWRAALVPITAAMRDR